MHDPLLRNVRAVAWRFRQRRLWWSITAVALLASLVGVGLVIAADSGWVIGRRAAAWLLAAAAVSLVVAWGLALWSFRDPRTVAARIEERFPSLQQRLLTALGLLAPKAAQGHTAGSLGYLQRRVIDEAHTHARTHRWADTVPPGQLAASRAAGGIAIVALAATTGWLAWAKPPVEVASQSPRDMSRIEVTVDPGDVEIERGTSLVVTARFAANAPEEAELVCLHRDGSERRLPMTRNLSDPVVGTLVSGIEEPFRYQVISGDWRSEPYQVEVFDYPALVRSDAELKYPGYTELADRRVEDTRRVSAVEGTELTWTCFLNKPVESAELVSQDGSRQRLGAGTEPRAVTATLAMLESQRWTLELTDAEGRKNKFPPELVARVLPNEPPSLKLQAARDVRVSPLEELPIAAEVSDDFGITRAGIQYTFAGGEPQEIVLGENVDGSVTETLEHLIALESLGAEPDQLLSYHLWAEDFGPEGEVRRSQSDMFFAEVRPFEEIFRQGQQPPGGQSQQQGSQNGQQAEKLAELQKEIINATWRVLRDQNAGRTDSERSEKVQLIAESQATALEQLQELASQINDPESRRFVEAVDQHMTEAIEHLQHAEAAPGEAGPLREALSAEQASYQALLSLRAREFQVTRSQQSQGSSSSSSSSRRQQQLEQLELDSEDNRYETQQQAAAPQEDGQQREIRQVLSRLRDLARRQQDLNEQINQLQSALQQAESEQQEEEIRRQLKRLRDQQQELLRETDELSQRMQQPENRQAMDESRRQLEQTRENVRRASEALQQRDAAEALSAGRRAEREFDQLEDEFRRKAAGEFSEAVRQMRSAARQLDQQQQQLGEQMRQLDEQDQPGLRSGQDREAVRQAIDQQRDELQQLMQQMQQTVEQAESSEPLLAEKLYESHRQTERQEVDRRLEETNKLLQRGFDAEAGRREESARDGIEQLREGLEEAASSVLGDETESLQRALGELETLSDQLEQEMDQANPDRRSDAEPSQQTPGGPQDQPGTRPGASAPPGQPGEPGRPGEQQRAGEQDASGRSEQGNQRQDQPGDSPQQPPSRGGQQDPSQQNPSQQGASPQQGSQQDAPQPRQPEQRQPGSEPGQPQQGESQQSQSQPGQGQQSQPGQSQQGQSQQGQSQQGQSRQGQSQQGQSQQGGSPQAGGSGGRGGELGELLEQLAGGPSTGGGPAGAAPLTGEGFREWSDRLRDVEQLVEDPELRSRAARIRDRAREVRREVRRHSKTPQWSMVEEMIATPLRELRRDVAEELLRRSAEKNATVPIDRDPVPEEFTEAVRRYYENLGSGR